MQQDVRIAGTFIQNEWRMKRLTMLVGLRMDKHNLPTHVLIEQSRYGLQKDSMILLEQVRTIDKSRLRDYIGHLDFSDLLRVNRALMVSMDLGTQVRALAE